MKLSAKILLIWLGILGIYLLALALFQHVESPISATINQLIQAALLVISVYLCIKEPNRKNKFVFLNFIFYFSLSIVFFAYEFVGKDFLVGKYSRHLFSQYSILGFIFFEALAVIYLVIDLLFNEFKIYQKYLLTFAIVLVFFGYFFHPYFSNPLYLYSTEEIKQWKTLDAYLERHPEATSAVDIANNLTLQSWHNGVAIGDLYPEENLRRIEILLSYTGDSWMVLLWKPMYDSDIKMSVLLVGFILLFFGYQYKKDPPQGAYIDKIMFLMLLLTSMDILHNWGFIKSVEWGSLIELFSVGQYITIAAELIMVLFFALRLQFITSVQGEFYEAELAANPHQVSRWRDWVDNMVLSHFFNFKLFNGRLFQNPSGK